MRASRQNISSRSRRGVTLLEMLVTVALLLLMMLIIVAIFQSATGAVTTSRAYTLLDQDLRRLEKTIRQDLGDVDAIMTPPGLDPLDTRPRIGYFEYAENALSDAQDEDSDDTLRFTATATQGRYFTGRMWVPKAIPGLPPLGGPPADSRYTTFATFDPIPVVSQSAEIIYFQRGDKLYRRVLLIQPIPAASFTNAPAFAGTLSFGNTPTDPARILNDGRLGSTRFGFRTTLFEPAALFQPITAPNGTVQTLVGPVPFVSWQGLNDVSARPSKYNPLKFTEYAPALNSRADLADRHNRFASPRFSDDFRNNTTGNNTSGMGAPVPDGLYDDMDGNGVPDYHPNMYFNSWKAGLLNDGFTLAQSDFTGNPATIIRPLHPDLAGFPWVYPNAFTGNGIANQASLGIGRVHATDPSGNSFNHNPLVSGDSLTNPDGSAGSRQTWWGFPTWRETMAPTWLDPIKRINDPAGAPFFINAANDPIPSALGEVSYQQTVGLSTTQTFVNGTPFLLPPQNGPFDSVAALSSVYDLKTAPVFEDDLIAVNVRSFNIKALDPNAKDVSDFFGTTPLSPGYYDLGYGAAGMASWTPFYLQRTLGHEGRMPPLLSPTPLVGDNRVDAQYNYFIDPTSGATLPTEIGDNEPTLVRLRRTWDSWSTTYTNPSSLSQIPLQRVIDGIPFGRPVFPSYPAPYPVPLKGIEIQIRVTDPTSRYVKTLTIRQDFSGKL